MILLDTFDGPVALLLTDPNQLSTMVQALDAYKILITGLRIWFHGPLLVVNENKRTLWVLHFALDASSQSTYSAFFSYSGLWLFITE
jgi:hypothetical protein